MQYSRLTLTTCIGAPIVQREAGERERDYVPINLSLTKKLFLMDLVGERVDQKKKQFGDFHFGGFFREQDKQFVSSDAGKSSAKFMRTSSDISSRQREDLASTSGVYSEDLGKEFVGNNGSLLSLQPWIFKREKCLKRIKESSDSCSRWSFDLGGFSWTPHGSPRRINPGSHSFRSKKGRQDGYNFRPVTFSENIFMPHICNDNVRVEEYTFNFHPSSSVNDERLSCLPEKVKPRSRDANWMSVDSSIEQPVNRCDDEFGSLLSSEKDSIDQIGDSVSGKLRSVIGVPHLPLRRLRKEERKSIEAMPINLGASISQKLCKISDPFDSHDGMFLFILGIAIGVTTNIVSLRMEIEKLNKLLKDNRNLVQDLHDELEMNDLFTLKELANGTNKNEELGHNNLDKSINALQNQNSTWHAAAFKMDDCDNLCMTKVGEDLSEIEAELEAELERLEQNINASSLEQRIDDLIELDSELIADVVTGELREDLLIKCAPDDDINTTTTSTAQARSANYSVSPKELSLRLHKVIENRLEERIKELEIELEQAQLKLKLAEAERSSSTKPPFSYSDAGSSSSHDSPNSLKRENSSLRLDLSGDALIAYDEAYEEFMRLADTEDEKLPYSLSSADKNVPEDGEKEQACEQILWRTGSYDISATDDDDDDDGGGDDDDSFDEGNDLIQKILEKTRKGSPALLNAQKMLSMMDL